LRLCLCGLQGPNGLQPSTWAAAFAAIKEAAGGLQGNEIKAIAGKLTDAETMMATKDLLNRWAMQ
jgi:NADH dehydrogenase (ubiquinone) Fe-S protein 1